MIVSKNMIFSHRGEYLGKIGDNHVIVLEDTEYELSPAAFYVWFKSDGARTVQQLIEEASDELGMSKEQLDKPITIVIEELYKNNLLERTED